MGLPQAIHNGTAGVLYFNASKFQEHNNNSTLGIDILKYKADYEEREFVKFGVVCKVECRSNWILGSERGNQLHKCIPRQNPFFTTSEFWSMIRPSFAAHFWPSFLGMYVQSGLHDFLNKTFSMWNQFKFQKTLRNHGSGLSNGSLFSYIFLAKRETVMEDFIQSTNISTFRGTAYITCTMFNLSVVIFMLELWGYSIIRVLWTKIRFGWEYSCTRIWDTYLLN